MRTGRLHLAENPDFSGVLETLLVDPWGTITTLVQAAGAWLLARGQSAAVLVGATTAAVVAARRWWFHRCQRALHTDARIVTILAPPSVDPAGAQALWSNLVGLLRPAWKRALEGQPHVAFEYRFDRDGVQLRLWVPGSMPPGLVERAIEAAWPGARTATASADPPLPQPAGEGTRVLTTGGELRLARSEALPIRTDFAADPIRALLGAPAGLGPHDAACVQVLARPVTGRRVALARRSARHLQAGHSRHWIGRLLDLLTPGPTPASSAKPHRDPHTALVFAAQDRAIVAKDRGSQYDTLVRYAVTTDIPRRPGRDEFRRAAEGIRGRAHAIASAFSTFTEHNHYRRTRLRRPPDALARRRLRRGDLLSVPELAVIAHLPTDEAIPGVARAGARAVPPPPATPTKGHDVRPIGLSDTAHARPVGLHVSDARHHLHVLGATGSGKSTLLAQMILADAEHRRGAVVIDPKGDLITDVLTRLPLHAASKVVLFDADARGPVPCLNPLEGDKHAAVDNVVSVFARIFASAWGPRTDDILRAACLTLRADSDTPTLADLPGLLTDPAKRIRHLAKISDDSVLGGFWTAYDQLSDAARAHAIAPLLNKLRAFLLRPFVVKAIAAGPSTVALGAVLDGGLLLARIPKGSLGEDTSRLLGSLIVARVWQATTARSAQPQSQRQDAALYIDEAQNFLNLPYAVEDMLAEARGYRLSMTLAHQHLDQLGRDLNEAISANARTKIYFSVSPHDARDLARHTAPHLTDHDLAHLDAYHAAARLVVNGAEARPFTVKTRPLGPAIPGRARIVRAAAAAHTRPLAKSHAGPAERVGADPRRAA